MKGRHPEFKSTRREFTLGRELRGPAISAAFTASPTIFVVKAIYWAHRWHQVAVRMVIGPGIRKKGMFDGQ
jgi:hypothetical protein